MRVNVEGKGAMRLSVTMKKVKLNILECQSAGVLNQRREILSDTHFLDVLENFS